MGVLNVPEQIFESVLRLAPDQQRAVLRFTQSLGDQGTLPPGAKLEDLLRFAGTIPPEDLREMAEAIEEGCERINPDAW